MQKRRGHHRYSINYGVRDKVYTLVNCKQSNGVNTLLSPPENTDGKGDSFFRLYVNHLFFFHFLNKNFQFASFHRHCSIPLLILFMESQGLGDAEVIMPFILRS